MRAAWEAPAGTESAGTTEGDTTVTEEVTEDVTSGTAVTETDEAAPPQTSAEPASSAVTENESEEKEKKNVLPWILLGVGIGAAVCAASSFAVFMILKKRDIKKVKPGNKGNSGKTE